MTRLCTDLQVINPLDFPGWDDLVLTADNYSFFHSSAWIRVLCESYGYRPSFFALSRNGELSVVVPMLEVNSLFTGRRGVSLPFSDYCEPIVFDRSPIPDLPVGLLDFAKKAGWKYLRFRGQNIFPPGIPIWFRYACHSLKIPADEKSLFATFHTNTVRNIKKARASDLQINILNSFESLEYYYYLHCITRKRQGIPPQPFSFFEKVFEHVCSKGKGIVVLAYLDKKPVAGAVYFHFGRKAMYKYGASDTTAYKLGANAAVMWEALKEYTKRGYEHFCLGRTDLNNKGLRRFKAGFGANEHFLNYYRFDLGKNAFVNGNGRRSFQPSLMKYLPVSALKLLGSAYGHFG